MERVWILLPGEYGNYDIVGVYSTEERAQARKEELEAEQKHLLPGDPALRESWYIVEQQVDP